MKIRSSTILLTQEVLKLEKIKKVLLIVSLLFLGIVITTMSIAEEALDTINTIYLKDGTAIECDMGWIEGDTFYYRKYGGTVGISLEIVDIDMTYKKSIAKEKNKRKDTKHSVGGREYNKRITYPIAEVDLEETFGEGIGKDKARADITYTADRIVYITSLPSPAAGWIHFSGPSPAADWIYFSGPSPAAKYVYITEDCTDAGVELISEPLTSAEWVYISGPSPAADWIYFSGPSPAAEWVYLTNNRQMADYIICIKEKKKRTKENIAILLHKYLFRK